MVVDTDKKRGKKREGKKRGVFFQHHSTSTGMEGIHGIHGT